MHQLALELATVVALVAAGLVGAIGVWQGLSVWAIAFRAMISGGLIFFFALVGATILGRSILHEIALRQMVKRQHDLEEKARQEAALGASPLGEGAMRGLFEPMAEASTEPNTAESGRNAA